MRLTLSAIVIAAGLVGFGVAAQAAPVSPANPLGIASEAPLVQVQMARMERRMMRNRMERRMMRRDMERRMMRRQMERRMMRRNMMRRM